MSSVDFDELLRRINEVPKDGRGRRTYTAVLRRDIIAYVGVATRSGRSQAAVCRELGVHQATISEWTGRRAPRKAKTGKAKVKRVVLAAPVEAESPAVTLVLRGGHRVEGLDVECLVELVKALG